MPWVFRRYAVKFWASGQLNVMEFYLFYDVYYCSSLRLIRYGNCGLATHLIEAWCGITGFTGTAIKIVIFSVHKDRIYRIIQLAMLDWANARETSVRQIMSQYAQRGRIAYIAQIGAAAMIVFEISLTRLPCFTVDSFENNYSSTRNLILGPPCWIPSTMPASLYFVYYFSTFIGLWVIVFFYTGCDAFMIAAALHICCQLEILNASLENLSDEDSHTHQRFRINEYSKRHNKLLVLGNELNHAVQLIIFADIFSNMSVICISGIAILVNVRNENMNNDILNLVLRMCLGYTGLFMYSYVGEKLSSQADKSRTILYACPWYNMPMDIVKDIGFMIMRNNSFCYLTIGGVFVMNYESFKRLTKLMFSYFSVLKLMLT
ncbi:odorant receptor 22c-like isoform X2 [Fopius arisanus]|uniref:Odorant receptor n=1 Tax=Fopius arisanus TaxID=64838 RepID=A0A9R1TR42_9HYME|nr:PREDICTED: odorant receptor 22c-like isoform X2 [Fopius arisanus]